MSVFTLKARDLLPILEVALKDPALEDGTTPAHDLTGATGYKLHLRAVVGGSVITRDMTPEGALTAGVLRYTWQATDWSAAPGVPVLAAGTYNMEYEVIGGGSGRMTFPNDGYDTLRIVADIGQG